MSPRVRLWLLFAASLAVALVAMGWVSLTALRAFRAEAAARRQAAAEEVVRLALWRMDTALAPLLAEENARPLFAYRPFYPAKSNLERALGEGPIAGPVLPSPLLTHPSPLATVYFQYEPNGQLTSPQAPTGADRAMAVPKYLSERAAAEAARRLEAWKSAVDRERLAARLPRHELARMDSVVSASARQAGRLPGSAKLVDSQQSRAGREFALRNEVLQQNVGAFQQAQQMPQLEADDATNAPYGAGGLLMTPLWLDGRLVLARRFSIEGRETIQGCLLDWPAVKTMLLDVVADILPKADLLPAVGASGDESRRLAALPLLLAPGGAANGLEPTASPLIASLALAWVCAALAAAAVAGLLWGVVRLSERRAAFVSAVTHELRTPLTTFQMYAEMLADGMVPEENDRRRYLHTLRAEALRLTHLVENVLSYARLERGRAAGRIETFAIAPWLKDVAGRLAARAEQAGMSLVVEPLPGERAFSPAEKCAAQEPSMSAASAEQKCRSSRAMVSANRSAVEQVLFNLVDNACKYAGGAADKRIHLGVELGERCVEIIVADHGPGIAPAARKRLFRSFSKTAAEAAASAPGIGLGLALSRRLARDMGGDLRFDASNAVAGARFVLRLPLVVKPFCPSDEECDDADQRRAAVHGEMK